MTFRERFRGQHDRSEKRVVQTFNVRSETSTVTAVEDSASSGEVESGALRPDGPKPTLEIGTTVCIAARPDLPQRDPPLKSEWSGRVERNSGRGRNISDLASKPKSENVRAPVPRVALRVPDEAAAALGVSVDFFNAHCRSELRDRKSTRLNSSHVSESRMPSSA